MIVAALCGAAGCTGEGTSSGGGATEVSGEITVYAAASLQSTFTELGRQFESVHPGTEVTFTFAGSSDLATQLSQGAPGDVFAAADRTTMSTAIDAGVIAGDASDFATNTLTIVTAPGNPLGIESLADLADPAAQVVLCAPRVPCGAATSRVESVSGVDIAPVSEESSVTDVLGKVTSGQADAGLVYVTDALSAGDRVAVIDFPESADAVNTYPIATVADSSNRATAEAFVSLVVGPQGQQVLTDAGFRVP